MDKKVLTICSSYQRPVLARRMIESYIKATSSTNAHLVVYVGEKDPFIEEYRQIQIPTGRASAEIVYGPRLSMVQVLNKFSSEGLDKYDYFSEINDDHVAVTEGWETKLAEAIDRKNNGFSISYGQTQQFPTAVMFGKKLISGLGYMFPPEYAHTYVDRWLMDLGFGANITIYVPDVLVDHLHPVFNKGEWDNVYYDGGDEMHVAQKIYEKWCVKKEEDIVKVRVMAREARIISADQIPDLSDEDLVCMMTTYDRIDLLERTISSLAACKKRPRIFSFDDFGPDHKRVVNAVLKLQDAVVVSDQQHRGIEGCNYWAMQSLFDKGAKRILILDSDCLVAKTWWSTAVELSNIVDLDRNVLCLFNCRVHASTPLATISGLVSKKYVGGLGLLVSRFMWDNYLVKIREDGWVGWDGNLCNRVIKDGMKVLACTPSVIQHTGGRVGAHAGIDATEPIADDFAGDPEYVKPVSADIKAASGGVSDVKVDQQKPTGKFPYGYGPGHPDWDNPGKQSLKNKWLAANRDKMPVLK